MESLSLPLISHWWYLSWRGQGALCEWDQEPILSLLAAHKPHFSQCYRDLALVSRDGMNIVLNKINQILLLTLLLTIKMKLLVDQLGNVFF